MKKKSRKELRRIDLRTIKDPSFLKDLSYKELRLLAEDIRGEILHATSIYGGHLSSNLGIVELTIALHRSFHCPKDKLIFDVGHQCYAHKILTGRPLDGLRQKGSVAGFQKRSESPYDCYEAGHSSTSISAALGFATARDLKGEKYDVIPVIGDASIVSGLAFEGLNNLAHEHHKVIVVLNDNGMSISRPVGGLSRVFARISTAAGYNRMKVRYTRDLSRSKCGLKMLALTRRFKNWVRRLFVPSTFFDDMGFVYVGPIDGHDIKALEKAFRRAKNTASSCIIHVLTHKGQGYPPAEADVTGYWHGVSPFDIKTGRPKDMHEGYVSWSHVFSDLTLSILHDHPETVLIAPGTEKGSGLEQVFAAFPRRAIDVGIAEEHAFTLASGFALNGYHPIISIYSTFLQRAYDQILHDLARMELSVTVLVDRSGLVGADGETHQGLYDVAFLRSIPGVIITMPSTIAEAKALYLASLAPMKKPFFIRLPRSLVRIEKDVTPPALPFGRWRILSKDKELKTAVVTCGPLLHELHDLIQKKGLDVTLMNAIYLAPLDQEAVSFLARHDRIIIYDPYSIALGLAVPLLAALKNASHQGKTIIRTVPKAFIPQASIKEQLFDAGLLPEDIVDLIEKEEDGAVINTTRSETGNGDG